MLLMGYWVALEVFSIIRKYGIFFFFLNSQPNYQVFRYLTRFILVRMVHNYILIFLLVYRLKIHLKYLILLSEHSNYQ